MTASLAMAPTTLRRARLRLFPIALAFAFAAASLAGCGGGPEDPTSESASESAGADSASPTESAAPAEAGEENPMADDSGSGEADLVPTGPVVSMRTSLGDLRIELFPDEAPETVANFLEYVEDGFYDGTVFHRVVRGFVIQGGGFTADMVEKETRDSIRNEATNGLQNRRGTLAMARTRDPHSASSQFFVNTKDNAMLNHTGQNGSGWGYAVFGRVISGMEAVDRIEASPVVSRNGFNDVPDTPVVIESATVVSR